MARILYIPYTYADGPELRLMAQSWKSNARQRLVIMHYKSGLKLLSSLGPRDVIYVLCHYAESVRSVISSLAGDNPLFHDQLGDRIAEDGLDAAFGGKLKLFACEAGAGGNSFASQWANYMRNTKHFVACRFYAYTKSVSGPGEPGGSKLALELPDHYDEDADLTQYILGSAKAYRVTL
jgi:hypothetical protein